MTIRAKLIILFVFAIFSHSLNAQQTQKPAADAGELAKKLANPVASLISVPLQNNTDVGIGVYHGYKNTMNVQPVVPISLSSKLNLITRYIIPVITQHNITGQGVKQTGLSDAVISAFFSPAVPKNGVVWGVGPVFLVPIATNDLLGTEKLGVGPTALILKQTHGLTFGILANQIWSIAGNDSRSDVNQLYLQPFFNYNWKSGAGIGISGEITQNWEGSNTTAFIVPSVSGVTKLGKQIVSIVVGPLIQVAAPDNNEADFGVRAALTFVFPK